MPRPALSKKLLREVRACTICAPHLPLGARPVVRGRVGARLLIISQAPGTRVHETGLSFNDRSGDRLRDWLGIGREVFYDEDKVAVLPMGFCYPGVFPRGGDRPPRPECAPQWHERLLVKWPNIALTLLVGSYAIDYYLRDDEKADHDRDGRGVADYLPRYLPMPHPSWRTTAWERKNPGFSGELVPEIRRRVASLVA